MKPRRGLPRFRHAVEIRGDLVVHRDPLGRIEGVRREELAEVGWAVDEGMVTDRAYLMLMDTGGRGVAVPEDLLPGTGLLDWCAELPGWDWDVLARAQADVGPHWRGLWERPGG